MRGRLAAAALLLAATASPAPAQTADPATDPAASPVAAQSATAVFGDWTSRCTRAEGGAALCEAAQFIHLPGGPKPVAQIMVRQAGADFALLIEVAPDVTLGPGLAVTFGEGIAPLTLVWERCLPAACIAAGTVAADRLRAFMAQGTPGRFTFTTGRGEAIAWPLSPRGLEQAVQGVALD